MLQNKVSIALRTTILTYRLIARTDECDVRELPDIEKVRPTHGKSVPGRCRRCPSPGVAISPAMWPPLSRPRGLARATRTTLYVAGRKNRGVEPFAVDIAEPQTVAICACRHSANRPFCDGTHKSLAAE